MVDGIARGPRGTAGQARGASVPGPRLHIPEKVDVAAVRGRTGLSQWAFARRIGVSPATLRNWEQGRRRPEGPARVLLAMLDRNPRIVEETLARSDLARPDEGPAAQSASSTAPAGGRS